MTSLTPRRPRLPEQAPEERGPERLRLARADVPAGPDHALHIVGRHQQLQHGPGHGTQEVAITGLLQELGQGQPLVGHHRISSSVGVGA